MGTWRQDFLITRQAAKWSGFGARSAEEKVRDVLYLCPSETTGNTVEGCSRSNSKVDWSEQWRDA